MQAQVLMAGGRLYVDIIDRRAPLVPYIYAAIFAVRRADDLIAVHVVAMLWILATALLLQALGARRFGQLAGWWAAFLFALSSVSFLPAETQAANLEIFMLLPIVAAVYFADVAPDVKVGPTQGLRPIAYAFGSGVMVALAMLCKQTAGVTIVPVAWMLARQPNRTMRLAACANGLALTIAAAALWFGPRELYFWTVGSTTGYLAPGGALPFELTRGVEMTLAFAAANAALVWLCIIAGRRRGGDDAWLWLWLGTSAIAVAAGLRFLGHYYLQLLPAACLLGGREASALAGNGRRRLAAAVAVPACVFASLAFFSPKLHGMPDYQNVAAYVRANSAPSDRIAVWGHFPEVYWASDRRSAMRFVHTGYLTGASPGRPPGSGSDGAVPGAWDAMFADFAAHPPVLLLDTSTAKLRDYEHYPLTRYPALAGYVADNYQRCATIDGIAIYHRR
jgi:4-amino-4-deoxy-L-arabinose transferase-like glycosyltransferase